MQLAIVEIVQGVFCLLFVVISIILGTKILYKYFTYKQESLIFVGLTWIGMSFPWVPDAINLILILGFNTSLNDMIYFTIVIAFLPFPLTTWLIAFFDFFSINKKKTLLVISIILTSIFEFFYFSILFHDISLIGYMVAPFLAEYTVFFQLYFLVIILTFSITGIIFAAASLKADKREIRLKGKLILIAFILFTLGAILEAVVPLTTITVVFSRSVLISSAIMYYIGFILPERIKRIFLK